MKNPRRKLKDKLGELHLRVLKLERNNSDTCEICGRRGVVLGRFHILRTASHLRLEYIDENILLTDWFPCHNAWHSSGANDPRNIQTFNRIIELCGKNYKDKLLLIEKTIDKHSMLYLEALYFYFKERLKKLEEGSDSLPYLESKH